MRFSKPFFSFPVLSATIAVPLTVSSDQPSNVGHNDSSVALSDVSCTNVSLLSKRWDGSPAMGDNLMKAKSKECTLWSILYLNDADVGRLFNPSRAVPHSGYL